MNTIKYYVIKIGKGIIDSFDKWEIFIHNVVIFF